MIKETLSQVNLYPLFKRRLSPRATSKKSKKAAAVLLALSVFPVVSHTQVFAQEGPLVATEQVKSWQNGANNSLHCQVQSPHLLQFSSLSRAKLDWVLPAGSRVKQGQLIAKQDGYFLEREIQQLELDLASAVAEHEYAAKEFQRLNALDKQLVSPSTLNELQGQLQLTKLAKARLTDQLKEARYRYRQLEHFAPQDGQLLALQAQPGEYLNVGDNITRLQPQANKELVCDLPLSLYRENQDLGQVSFSLPPGQALTLLRTSDSVKTNSQTMQLYLKAPKNMQNQLLAGERLQVNISYQHTDLSLLPLDALELTGEGAFAWVLTADNKVNRTPVEIIASQKTHFVVKSKLQSGDRVVTIGKQGLAPEQQVQPSTENTRESE